MQRKKEKILRPSLRENKRYLLIESSKTQVEQAILDYIGILGFSKASPMFISNQILAINREMLNEVRASLLLAGIKVKKVSGTLAGLK